MGESVWAATADELAAENLARRSGCLKCHGLEKKKEGPSFKETSAKYKGKPDGEKKVTTQITTNLKVKIDGKEEEHEPLKFKDPADIKRVVKWILSR